MSTRILRALTLAALLSVTAAAHAAAPTPFIRCPNCNEAQMRNAALNGLPNAPGVFSNYVYNLPGNVIRRYSVECVSNTLGTPPGDASADRATAPVADGGDEAATGFGSAAGASAIDAAPRAPCSGIRVLTSLSVPLDLVNQLDVLHQAYVATNGTMKALMETYTSHLPYSNGPPSVYDIAGSQTMQADIGQSLMQFAFEQPSNVWGFLQGAAASAIGFFDGMTITIKVWTSDGGYVIFEWKLGDEEFTYKQGSARTAGNQVVPDTGNRQVQGRWTQRGRNGNFDDLREFADHLRRLGIPVVRGDNTPVGTVIPGPITQVDCLQMPDGRFLCRIIVLP